MQGRVYGLHGIDEFGGKGLEILPTAEIDLFVPIEPFSVIVTGKFCQEIQYLFAIHIV